MPRNSPPSKDDVLGWIDTLSNTGRWGADDQLGTLNLITPEHRVRASKLVTEGLVVPLGMDLDPGSPDPLGRGTEIGLEPTTYNMGDMFSARERLTLTPHGSLTHLDAPSHIGWKRRFYNGLDFDDVRGPAGVRKLDVANARGGIVSRGVLLDIAATRGLPYLENGDGIYAEDIEAAERAHGVRLEPGDVLYCRTGYLTRALSGETDSHYGGVGYHIECMPLLHERGVAVIASDALNDMNPSGYAFDGPATPDRFAELDTDEASLAFPVHVMALAVMGAWLLDHVEVEELARTCRRLGRHEFLTTIEPLR
ncbi:MAG: hypothetical protein JWR01_1667, partial [Subtercola sp.]|nr:hypothetical protein [Subtercola sp.]